MVSRNTTLAPFLGLRIRPACEAGLRAGMRREGVPPQKIKIKIKLKRKININIKIKDTTNILNALLAY